MFSGAIISFNNGTNNMQTQLTNEILAKVKCECCLETIWEDLKKPPELNPRIHVDVINTTLK